LCQPKKKDEAAVNAIWLDEREEVVMLQMTISNEHLVVAQRIKDILHVLNVEAAKLWFIMTEYTAQTFARQKLLNKDKRVLQKERDEPNVEQSVVRLH
jgi:7-cyano-7-deazaguanine synthase in queuosine biosynthesis